MEVQEAVPKRSEVANKDFMAVKLLDLFCGAGGCSVGYSRAGFDVVGVDLKPQPNYPFEFIQADAMTFPLDGFDVIHASPPCQKYSAITRGMGIADDRPDLVGETRERLGESGAIYIIENVIGSPLINPRVLCGSMFSLGAGEMWLRRHRLFEVSVSLAGWPRCNHPQGMTSIGVYGNGTNKWHREKLGRNIMAAEQREAMGIDWMSRKELTQAIPPAYTEWIGRKLLHQVFAAKMAKHKRFQ